MNDCEEGTLFIGGPSVSDGYINDPDLTSSVFIKNPYIKGCAKIYNTGDRVTRLADGNIAFIGRIDQQVKINGFRVECSEVAFSIEKSRSIKTCLVNKLQLSNGQFVLVAYCIPEFDSKIDLNTIKKEMSKDIPIYMIPRYFVLIDVVPTTKNGKVDYGMLPLPDLSNRFSFSNQRSNIKEGSL